MKTVLKAAKRQVGLKPIRVENITESPIIDDINQPYYSEMRKEAAAEFITKELKLQPPTIMSTKMSQSSPIMWIEVQDSDTADMLMRQSAKIRNPNGQAIMYHPPRTLPYNKINRKQMQGQKSNTPTIKIPSETRTR